MPWLEPVSLKGPYARLEPLSQDQCEGLTEAVKDGELWKLWYTCDSARRRHAQGDRPPAWVAGVGRDDAMDGITMPTARSRA